MDLKRHCRNDLRLFSKPSYLGQVSNSSSHTSNIPPRCLYTPDRYGCAQCKPDHPSPSPSVRGCTQSELDWAAGWASRESKLTPPSLSQADSRSLSATSTPRARSTACLRINGDGAETQQRMRASPLNRPRYVFPSKYHWTDP